MHVGCYVTYMNSFRFTLVILLFLTYCASSQTRKLSKLPDALRSEQYYFSDSQNLIDRLQTPSEGLVKYLAEMDQSKTYKSYTLNSDETRILDKYIKYLPSKFSTCLREHKVNFVFIENFKGGGMIQYTISSSRQISAFVILNPKILTVPLQKWIEYRDNSAFFGQNKITLRIPLGNSHPALLSILIHEAAHIYDLFNNVTPYVDSDLYDLGLANNNPTPFTENVWADFHVPVPAYEYAGRMDIRSYGLGEPIDSIYIRFFFEQLSKTPFVSLYGARFWSEDYAETYTWCYLNAKMQIEYFITAYQNNQKIFTYYSLRDEKALQRCESVL